MSPTSCIRRDSKQPFPIYFLPDTHDILPSPPCIISLPGHTTLFNHSSDRSHVVPLIILVVLRVTFLVVISLSLYKGPRIVQKYQRFVHIFYPGRSEDLSSIIHQEGLDFYSLVYQACHSSVRHSKASSQVRVQS